MWQAVSSISFSFFNCSINYFLWSISGSQIVRHGGALGLGLAALGTARQDVYDLLKSNLYQDDAVTGVSPYISRISSIFLPVFTVRVAV